MSDSPDQPKPPAKAETNQSSRWDFLRNGKTFLKNHAPQRIFRYKQENPAVAKPQLIKDEPHLPVSDNQTGVNPPDLAGENTIITEPDHLVQPNSEPNLETIRSEVKAKFGMDLTEFNPDGIDQVHFKLIEYSAEDNYIRFDCMIKKSKLGIMEYVLIDNGEKGKIIARRYGSIKGYGGEEKLTRSAISYMDPKSGLSINYRLDGVGYPVPPYFMSVGISDFTSSDLDQATLAVANWGHSSKDGSVNLDSLEIAIGERPELISSLPERVKRENKRFHEDLERLGPGRVDSKREGIQLFPRIGLALGTNNGHPDFIRINSFDERTAGSLEFDRVLDKVIPSGESVDGQGYSYQIVSQDRYFQVLRTNTKTGAVFNISVIKQTDDLNSLYEKSIGSREEWTSFNKLVPVQIS